MTEQHTPEDWKLLTAEALIERCVLYIQRIAELQREKAIANELLGSAQNELKQAMARIAELEAAQELVQVDEDEDLHDPINAGGQIQTMYSGTAFILTGYVTEADCIHLPTGYCIAKARPAE